MPPGIVSIGAALISGLFKGRAQKKAASQASSDQVKAAQLGIDEQRRQFDAMQELLAPYVNGGAGALSGMLALSGAGGASAEQSAIDQIINGPTYVAFAEQGEEAILANASATGGLRGGDTQGALAQFRPQLLNQMINDRFSQYGGIAGMGQASAAGVGAAGMNLGSNVAGSLGQIGQAQAGAALANGQATSDMWGNFATAIGGISGLSQGGQFGKGVF